MKNRIEEIRTKRGIRQEDFAKLMGLKADNQFLGKWAV